MNEAAPSILLLDLDNEEDEHLDIINGLILGVFFVSSKLNLISLIFYSNEMNFYLLNKRPLP